METAVNAAKAFVGAHAAAAKFAGGAVSKLSKKAVDYAKSDDAKEKMRADVTVAISVSTKMPFDISDDEARRYLLSNAISMAYGHAKSYLMVVTGLSPMGALTLPAILPSELAADSDASFQSE